jgi:hypothetical protein
LGSSLLRRERFNRHLGSSIFISSKEIVIYEQGRVVELGSRKASFTTALLKKNPINQFFVQVVPLAQQEMVFL